MRTSRFIVAAVIGVVGAGYAAASVQNSFPPSIIPNFQFPVNNLYSTATDWGGSYEADSVVAFTNGGEHVNSATGQLLNANQTKVVGTATPDMAGQIGWSGWGQGASFPNPVSDPVLSDSPTKPPALLTYTAAEANSVYGVASGIGTPGDGDLDGSTTNGLGDYDNSGNDSTTGGDANAFSPSGDYSGLVAPAGGLTFVYSGGYTSITSGEIGGDGRMLSAIGSHGMFFINFTLPGGATSIANLLAANPGATESYLGIGLRTFDSVDAENDLGGAYFDSPDITSANGIFTAEIPYNFSSYGPLGFADIRYGKFNIYYNSDLKGVSDFVTIDSMSVAYLPIPEPCCLSAIGIVGGLLMRRR